MNALRTAQTSELRWNEPEGLLPRGNVVVLGGRGESAAVYERFGSRLAVDAYRTIAFGSTDADDLTAVAHTIGAWIAETPDVPDGFPVRLTVVGSDTGALAALRLADQLDGVDALVLAGFPVAAPAAHVGEWQDELAERTTCPMHQRRLDADAEAGRGQFETGLPDTDIPQDLGAVRIPVLALHGGADTISPLDDVRDVYTSAPEATLWRIDGAKHDVLNDGAHRTVAAIVVQFLEARRTPGLRPLATSIGRTE